MDISLFMKIFKDKELYNFNKMKHKYGQDIFNEYLEEVKDKFYEEIDLLDFQGKNIFYVPEKSRIKSIGFKILNGRETSGEPYVKKAMREETAATFDIEDIEYKLESVRSIFDGAIPKDKMEERILGMKLGIEFISDRNNKINEENLFELYKMAIWDSLDEEDIIIEGSYYRHDTVYVQNGIEILHSGLSHELLESYMKRLIEYMNESSDDELVKSTIIHFYISYIHPYFDGNGRMARLVQMWYLIQSGYPGVFQVSLSKLIEENRKAYYKAFDMIEANQKISGVLDVTPFVQFINDKVFNKLSKQNPYQNTMEDFTKILDSGKVTKKEVDLWKFVISEYGSEQFSTKQLEKDFQNAAYATIRGFVNKFEELGLLTKQVYSNRNKYRVR